MARIGIIGAGISGLVSGWLLSRRHEVTLFEAGSRLGGHTHTVAVETEAGRWDVDTGFVVYNETTYPNFVRLLQQLGVATRPTEMSFSVACARTGLEYNGHSLNSVFAQRRNLFRPSFLRMLRDILRFNRQSVRDLAEDRLEGTLGDYLARGGYSRGFAEHYIVPMGAAIWSSSTGQMLDVPILFFVRFFHNHGLLGVDDHLQWRTLVGGSFRYIEPLTRTFRDRIHLRTPVAGIRRREQGVDLRTADGSHHRFDQVVLALHADQALRLLDDPSSAERRLLGSFSYQSNNTVLHTDSGLLPRRRRARASWNYHVPRERRPAVSVTYDMSRLQGLTSPEPFCVTLNRSSEIDPARILRTLEFTHPVFSAEAIAAQPRKAEISGVQRTHYCGAYWGNGFHEDGVNSALSVGRAFGLEL